MRKFLVISAACAALAGCNSVATADNALATLAKNQVPAACAIVSTAEGYYGSIVGTPSPAVATAEAGVAIICKNPPADLAGAFATLLQEWTLIQAATVKPAAP